MLEAALSALALTGATTIVSAMATEAWLTTRAGVLQLLRHSAVAEARQAAVGAQLDGDADWVADDEDADSVRAALLPAWNGRLAALLRDHPDTADQLQVLVDTVRAALPPDGDRWVQNITAREHGHAYGAQGGNVIVHHAGPGQVRPPEARTARGEEDQDAS